MEAEINALVDEYDLDGKLRNIGDRFLGGNNVKSYYRVDSCSRQTILRPIPLGTFPSNSPVSWIQCSLDKSRPFFFVWLKKDIICCRDVFYVCKSDRSFVLVIVVLRALSYRMNNMLLQSELANFKVMSRIDNLGIPFGSSNCIMQSVNKPLPEPLLNQIYVTTVYPKKYAHGFCFAVLCCGYALTDFPISIRLTSLALWQSNDCPSASKATLMNMDKYFTWIHYERLHNHNKAKHNKTVCIFLGIYCIWRH